MQITHHRQYLRKRSYENPAFSLLFLFLVSSGPADAAYKWQSGQAVVGKTAINARNEVKNPETNISDNNRRMRRRERLASVAGGRLQTAHKFWIAGGIVAGLGVIGCIIGGVIIGSAGGFTVGFMVITLGALVFCTGLILLLIAAILHFKYRRYR